MKQTTQIAFFAILTLPGSIGLAHVTWTKVNKANASVVGLYHFDDETDTATGSVIAPATGVSSDANLLIGAPIGNGAEYSEDTPGTPFGPYSLKLNSRQTIETPVTFTGLDGDLTLEFWFKWEPEMTTSSLTVGLKSGAKIQLSRDTETPGNDRLGFSATHGSYISAPGFINWNDMGYNTGHWYHVGFTIHSAGILTGGHHDVYAPGTLGRVYIYGHQLGDSVDLAGLQVHDASALQIRLLEGSGVLVNEVAIWKHDWSNNGANHHPFSEGRGGSASAQDWALFD